MRIVIAIIAAIFLVSCGAKTEDVPLSPPDSSVAQSEAASSYVPPVSSAPPASSSEREKLVPVEKNLELLQSIDGVVLDYKKPESAMLSIEKVLRDEATGEIAVITNFTHVYPQEGRAEPKADSVDIQIFDGSGNAIAAHTIPHRYEPQIWPHDYDTEPVLSEPVFSDGLLAFFTYGDYYPPKVICDKGYFIYDYRNGTHMLTKSPTGAAHDSGFFAILTDYDPVTTHHSSEYLMYYNRTEKLCEVSVPHRMGDMWDFRTDFLLNASTKTVEIINEMVSAKIDINSDTATLDFNYTKEHLQKLLIKTDDGKKEVYEAWVYPNHWDSVYWGDAVVLDTESGEISYLGETDFVNFCVDSGHRLLVNECGELHCYDLDTSTQISDYMNITVDSKEFRLLGVGYDKAKACWLVARGEFVKNEKDKDNEYFHLYLDAYDNSGKLIKTVDTEQVVPAWFIIWINQAHIAADNGSATIRIGTGAEHNPETNHTARIETEFTVKYLE